MEIEKLVIKCITIPIIGTILVANLWLIFMLTHDSVHFYSDSVKNCIHQYYYNMIIYGATINMMFSALFFKKKNDIINVYNLMIKEHYNKKPHTHLLLNMMMIQFTSGFIDLTIYQTIKDKYEQNICDQVYDSYFVIHQI